MSIYLGNTLLTNATTGGGGSGIEGITSSRADTADAVHNTDASNSDELRVTTNFLKVVIPINRIFAAGTTTVITNVADFPALGDTITFGDDYVITGVTNPNGLQGFSTTITEVEEFGEYRMDATDAAEALLLIGESPAGIDYRGTNSANLNGSITFTRVQVDIVGRVNLPGGIRSRLENQPDGLVVQGDVGGYGLRANGSISPSSLGAIIAIGDTVLDTLQVTGLGATTDGGVLRVTAVDDGTFGFDYPVTIDLSVTTQSGLANHDVPVWDGSRLVPSAITDVNITSVSLIADTAFWGENGDTSDAFTAVGRAMGDAGSNGEVIWVLLPVGHSVTGLVNVNLSVGSSSFLISAGNLTLYTATSTGQIGNNSQLGIFSDDMGTTPLVGRQVLRIRFPETVSGLNAALAAVSVSASFSISSLSRGYPTGVLGLAGNAVQSLQFNGLKTGTLTTPPSGLQIDEVWLDTTGSTVHPAIRLSTVVTT